MDFEPIKNLNCLFHQIIIVDIYIDAFRIEFIEFNLFN